MRLFSPDLLLRKSISYDNFSYHISWFLSKIRVCLFCRILSAVSRLEDDSKNFWISNIPLSLTATASKCLLHVHVRTLLFRIYIKDKFKLFLFSPTYFFHICFFVAISHNFKRLRCHSQLCILVQYSSLSECHLRYLVIS